MASTSSAAHTEPTASPRAASAAAAAAAAPSPAAKPPGAEQPRPILETTWHALSQAPPPSLREILTAYNTKGEGDRDMLVALLNAKSAEDQRLASLASLHQTVLQMQHAIAIAAVTAQQPAARPAMPQPQPQSSRRKRSHAEYAPDAYRAGAYDDREPPLPPSPDSSASGSSPRADFPHLANPSTMSIRTLLHPSKRRREAGYDERERAYDERDRERERDRDRERERAYIEDRDYRSRARPHVVVHPPTSEREYRHAMRTSSARDESHESGRSP
ncbi:hypothetical protein BN14_00099 [Rhizoctonia solani AG-1 IB]|uniref:Uncharacterized protein n=1 Tax=Thanatephorus cucumeris (strain AG1-IB / isolate 7/3/14) TaxID=1108050 RepID=M5BQL4_THACB|nr:hypothetical protein BN14_00099 [Rhizoctonia solani AG-1 IB]